MNIIDPKFSKNAKSIYMNIMRTYSVIHEVLNLFNHANVLPAAGGNFWGSRHQMQTGINDFERVFDGFRYQFSKNCPPGARKYCITNLGKSIYMNIIHLKFPKFLKSIYMTIYTYEHNSL